MQRLAFMTCGLKPVRPAPVRLPGTSGDFRPLRSKFIQTGVFCEGKRDDLWQKVSKSPAVGVEDIDEILLQADGSTTSDAHGELAIH